MSLTQWFTRSAPTVSQVPARRATFILVPTPSMELTRIGRASGNWAENRPPNSPMSLRTPGVRVAFTSGLIRARAWSWRLMSTPAAA